MIQYSSIMIPHHTEEWKTHENFGGFIITWYSKTKSIKNQTLSVKIPTWNVHWMTSFFLFHFSLLLNNFLTFTTKQFNTTSSNDERKQTSEKHLKRPQTHKGN